MSRSNPTLNQPNPSTRWFEWDGAEGKFRYYDKERKEQVDIGTKFMFILLDQLATVKGWHKKTDSGIVSNEVRDTRAEVLVVRCFGKKGNGGYQIASGFYQDIRDKVVVEGGHFTANCYIGYKPAKDQPLSLGSVQFKGASLSAWMEFTKQNRKAVYEQAVKVVGSKEFRRGSGKNEIIWFVPVFELHGISTETADEAFKLDCRLQEYLKGYLAQPKAAATGEAPQPDASGGDAQADPEDDNPFNGDDHGEPRDGGTGHQPEDDDVPF